MNLARCILFLIALPAIETANSEVLADEAVAKRVGIVVVRKLELRLDACQGLSGKQLEDCMAGLLKRFNRAVKTALDDRSVAGDAALIRLLGYYLGESYDEDIEHEVTARGKRLLVLLTKSGDEPPPCTYSANTRAICLPADVFLERRTRCIRAIRDGVTLHDN